MSSLCHSINKRDILKHLLNKPTFFDPPNHIYMSNSAACLIVRVLDFLTRCSYVAGSCDAVGTFVSEISDDWVGILHSSRVKIEWLKGVQIFEMIWLATSAAICIISNSERNLVHRVLNKNKRYERCVYIRQGYQARRSGRNKCTVLLFTR
jgi:hypothetical protein